MIEEIDFRRVNGMLFKRYRPKEETDRTIVILICDTTEERERIEAVFQFVVYGM